MGKPPSAVEMIERYHRIHGLDRLDEQWRAWEAWFADIEESHTSLAAVGFLPFAPAGSLLDHGRRRRAGRGGFGTFSVGHPLHPTGGAVHRAGFIALRRIADVFGIAYNVDPHYPEQPISVRRDELTRFVIAWRQGGRPSRAIVTRPGTISPAGG